MKSRKMVLMNLSAGQQWRCRHREQTCGLMVGEGEGVTNAETYRLPCVKLDSQWKFTVWCRKLKSRALWYPGGVGWSGRWVRRFKKEGAYVYLWLSHVDIWQKPTQNYKTIILQLKINLKKFMSTSLWQSKGIFSLVRLLKQSLHEKMDKLNN